MSHKLQCVEKIRSWCKNSTVFFQDGMYWVYVCETVLCDCLE